jgi:hypothetical protein
LLVKGKKKCPIALPSLLPKENGELFELPAKDFSIAMDEALTVRGHLRTIDTASLH